VRAHRSAAGGKGGKPTRPLADRVVGERRKSMRSRTASVAWSASPWRAGRFLTAWRQRISWTWCRPASAWCLAIRAMTATRSGHRSKQQAQLRTFRPSRTAATNLASPRRSTATKNAVERMFGRLKDFRRIATRYDRRADTFASAVALAATITYWLWVRSLNVLLPTFNKGKSRVIYFTFTPAIYFAYKRPLEELMKKIWIGAIQTVLYFEFWRAGAKACRVPERLPLLENFHVWVGMLFHCHVKLAAGLGATDCLDLEQLAEGAVNLRGFRSRIR